MCLPLTCGVIGLLVARVALRYGVTMLAGSDGMPFWIDDSLSMKTVLYTALVTPFARLTRSGERS